MPGSIYTLSAVVLVAAAAISFSPDVERCARLLPFGGFLLVSVSMTASTMLWRYYLGI
jgi:hypothetical protein